MALYPDLAGAGIHSMHFRLHASGGYRRVSEFWKKRGLSPAKENLAFTGYTRGKKRHTAFVRWWRTHDTCCEVLFGVEGNAPGEVFARTAAKDHRLSERSFREFIEFLRERWPDVAIYPRYGFQWPGSPASFVALPSSLRPVSLSFEVADEKGNPAMVVSLERRRGEGQVAILPSRPLRFNAEPVSEKFFQTAFEGASLLGQAWLSKL
jgi:hypothetical protein